MDLENKVTREQLVAFYALLGINPEKDNVFTKFQTSGGMYNDISKDTFGPYGCNKGIERAIKVPMDIVVIDIDNTADFDRIVDYITKLDYAAIIVGSDKTRIGTTGHERGGQIYFKRPSFWTEADSIQHRFPIAPLVSSKEGIEYKAQSRISGKVNIKTPMTDYHKKYFINIPSYLDELPIELYPINVSKSMISTEKMIEYCRAIDDREGRYDMFMKYHSTLAMNIINGDNIDYETWQQILINLNVFCEYSDDKSKTERNFVKELANKELYSKDMKYVYSVHPEVFGFEHGTKVKEEVKEEVVTLPEISAPKNVFVSGNAKLREELKVYEKFIESNAAPMLGLPQELKLLPGDNVGISAPTGSGKTTWLVSIAIQHLNAGKKVAMLILEETANETRLRILRQLKREEYDDNLDLMEVSNFVESTFRQDILNLVETTEAEIILFDYINDSFCLFDKTKNLMSFEKIKYTVATLCDLNHRTLKRLFVIGVQGTANLIHAKQKVILNAGKTFFEGGQSTIKPLQYAILLKEPHDSESAQYEKMAYVVKARNALVGGSNVSIPTYGVSYHKDIYGFNFLGSLKDLVKKVDTDDSSEAAKPKPKPKASRGTSTGGDF